MTTQQTIIKLANEVNINKIYAHHVFHNADKTQLHEDAARIGERKVKTFVKWGREEKGNFLKTGFVKWGLYPTRTILIPLKNT